MSKLRTELRASLATILNENNGSQPRVPAETKLINNLLREYLTWNGYSRADKSFSSKSKPNWEYLAATIAAADFDYITNVPMLYYVIYAFLKEL